MTQVREVNLVLGFLQAVETIEILTTGGRGICSCCKVHASMCEQYSHKWWYTQGEGLANRCFFVKRRLYMLQWCCQQV